MKQKVIVVGAGVAGLTAAHELSERDFEVHVIERRMSVGGKASSRRVKIEGGELPAEHGFRFFPGWYRHLPDTMSRIRTNGRRRNPNREPNVADNLVVISENRMHWSNRASVPVPMHLPRNVAQARSLATLVKEMASLDLGPNELAHFFMRLGQFLLMPEDQRREKLQMVTYWEYMEADDKSRAFKELVAATTRTMVAAKATEASAYTICRLAIRTLADALGSVDQILDGPTNEKWLDIWRDRLKEDGVRFHHGWELEEIAFDATGKRRIEALRFTSVAAANLGRLRWLIAPLAGDFLKLLDIERDGRADSPVGRALFTRFQANWAAFETLKAELESWSQAKPSECGLEPEKLRALVLAKAIQEKLEASHRWLSIAERVLEQLARARESLPSKEDSLEAQEQRKLTAAGYVSAIVGALSSGDAARLESSWAPHQVEAAQSRDDHQAVLSEFVRLQPDKVSAEVDRMMVSAAVVFEPYFVRWHEEELGAAAADFGRSELPPATADYYVMALPVEQMAYHVNRSITMTTLDPSLAGIAKLADHVDWMAGIQFYLKEEADLGPGHMVFMDSEWALTAIEQTQFWRGVGGVARDVKALISVDVSAWDRRGRFVNKEAFNCSDDELATEVWEQLKDCVRSERGQKLLHDNMLLGYHPAKPLTRSVNYLIDESIAELYDRRKQGAYERARSVRPSVTGERPADDDVVPYVYGPRRRFNAEPLLINRVGSHGLRPEASTRIENMFLASDYVRTETDLACMEGANEAARRAVNALLDHARSNRERCELFEFSLAGGVVRQLTAFATASDPAELLGAAGKFASDAADTATKLVSQTFGAMAKLWEKR